ncbi:carboxymuconolactone decarboxylase family protein [Hymenobacter sublimis]|uniref:Carboxymuconolactone decarboxylase family protein n=1 Tax=Hymenobacter sublimis TaxID=2933777 RepID=A0ABY4JFV4_9BACT|nr:carboxymuconolactone decarboxylase family protein [Hymenobacter sublimis]UPL51346.1 carboxymuconolactone decarboxylase family protein [Hymenobacter sublimis]
MTSLTDPGTQPPNEYLQLSEAAVRTYEQLWPGQQPAAQATDPDLVAVFHNFAFGDVVQHDELDVKKRLLALLAATVGGQALSQYRQLLDAALTAGVTPVEIKEVLYQVVPYVGMARVGDFLQTTNQRFIEKGIELPLESQSTTTPETRFAEGYAVQRIVVGPKLDDLHKNAPQDLLHFQHFLSANCFGDYFTRTGLDHPTREIVILSALIALGGTEPQMKGHIQGNANVGNDRQTLINVLTQLLPYVGYPRTLNAVACLNEILPPA